MNHDKAKVNEIIWLLFRLANRFSELEKTPVSFGTGEVLYPSEIHMIEAIGKNRGRTVTELCGRFGITKGAVSQTIGKLAAKGYIKKVRNADFGKEVLLSLTKKGERAFSAHEQLHDRMDSAVVRLAGKYDAEQLALITSFLMEAGEHLEKYILLGKQE